MKTARWNAREFFSERRYDGGGKADGDHQFVLRPSDGNPFLVYRDVGGNNSLNTYISDLGAYPNGGVSTFLEPLAREGACAFMRYSLAFAPGGLLPHWASGLGTCDGSGPIRLDGIEFGGSIPVPRPALTVSHDGTLQLLWNGGSNVFFTRWPADAPGPRRRDPLFTNVYRFGGEVRLTSDANGVLHAAVRGVDSQADFDSGAIVYLNSTDGGATWSPFEYVDPSDAVPGSIGANGDISLAVDAGGIPADDLLAERVRTLVCAPRRTGRHVDAVARDDGRRLAFEPAAVRQRGHTHNRVLRLRHEHAAPREPGTCEPSSGRGRR